MVLFPPPSHRSPRKLKRSNLTKDRSFESILASFAPPIVGILAQHVYGYKPIPKGSSDSVEIETDRENAASLAKALYTAIGIPMIICCFIYSFLYCTYPRDRERARMIVLLESELQQLEMEDGTKEGYCEGNVLESNSNVGMNGKEGSNIIEVDYYPREEQSIDLADNDEKVLLPR